MKKKYWKQIGIMAAALVISACSDGALKVAPPSPALTPPAPIILDFSADKTEISEDGSVTLNYEVAGADTVTISGTGTVSGAYSYAGEPMTELKGSVTIDGITETSEFVLTATKALPVEDENAAGEGEEVKAVKRILKDLPVVPAAGPEGVAEPVENPVEDEVLPELTTTATLTITVVPKVEIKVELTAEPAEVRRGEYALLRWNVEPIDVSISIKASNGENVMALSDCEGDVIANYRDFLSTEIGADQAIPAVGCAVVSPEAPETTYTLDAVDANGNKGSLPVTVKVDEKTSRLQAEIMASQKVVDRGAEVEISWNVSPEDAVITIVAEGKSDCRNELPVDRNDVPSGSVGCIINGVTAFTLTAEIDGETFEASVLVLVQGGVASALQIQATPWAFVGETIPLTIAPAPGNSASGIDKILINGVELSQGMSDTGVTTTATVTATGVTVELFAGGVETPTVYTPVHAVQLSAQSFSAEGISQSRALVDPADSETLLVGLDQNGYAKGIAKIAKVAPSGTSYMELKFAELIMGSEGLDSYKASLSSFFEKSVKTFPVSAIAVQKNGRLIAATTGLIAYKEKEDFKTLDILVEGSWEGKPYAGSHPSCFGKKQTGIKGDADRTELAFMRQVCDLMALGEDRLIVATDYGAFTLPSVSAYLKDKKKNPYCGHPTSKCHPSNATFKMVVSDLEVVGDTTDTATVLAATSSGVYQSTDGGMTWEAFGTIGQESFALSYDKTRNVVYAGTKAGVYVRAMNGGDWVQKGLSDTAVIALTVDGVTPGIESTLLAGTKTGAKISRDSGVTWSDIPVPGMKDKGEVRSVLIQANEKEGVIDYRLSVGGESGGALAKLSVAPMMSPTPSSSEEESPQEETQEVTE